VARWNVQHLDDDLQYIDRKGMREVERSDDFRLIRVVNSWALHGGVVFQSQDSGVFPAYAVG
jgi:hypothetical protein